MASAWPIGLICCFGLLLFFIVGSIIVALIPLYLPNHDSDLQYQSTQNQTAYMLYSATAEDGLTDSPNNLNSINNELNNQLGLKQNLLNVENVEIVDNAGSKKRRRRFVKSNSLQREKRETLSFLVLITIRITYPIMCRSGSCRTKVLGQIGGRCSERANIILQFIFLSYTNGPIRYNLVFLSLTIFIPSRFIQSQHSKTTTTVAAITGASTVTNGITTATGTNGVTTTATGTSAIITTTTSGTGITDDITDTTEQPMVSDNLIDGSDTTIAGTVNGACDVTVTEGLKWFGSYNLITLGDLSTTSIVKNRTLICGSYISTVSATFASEVGTLSSPLNYTFQLNGNFAQGNAIQIEKGSFGVGTNPSHNIVQNSVVQYTLDGRSINMNGGNDGTKVNVDNNLSTTCQSVTTSLKKLSQSLSQLTTTSGNTVTIPTTQAGPLNFNVKSVNANGISVFNLDGNQVLNNANVQQIEMIVDSSISSNLKLIVINLSGTDISFNQGNLVGTWFGTLETGRSHTIWNLPQATKLTSNRNWMGALLAPLADFTNSVQVDGSVAVNSLTSTAGINNPPIVLPNCI